MKTTAKTLPDINAVLATIDQLREQVATLASAREPSLGELVKMRDVKNHPNLPSEDSLRWIWFQRELNGCERAGAIVKRQGRVYVNLSKYAAWIAGAGADATQTA